MRFLVIRGTLMMMALLTACQSAKVTQLDGSNGSNSLNGNGNNAQVLNAGVVNTGHSLTVESMPSVTVSETYKIFYHNEIAANLSLAYGTLYTPLLNIYNNYLSLLAGNNTAPVPVELQQMVTLSFLNGFDLPSVTASLDKLMSADVAVLVVGQYAYLGTAILPPATASDVAISIPSITSPQFFKIGNSSLKVMGGKVGTSVNRKISTLTLAPNGTFSISTASSMIPNSASLYRVWAEPLSSTLASGASLSSSYVGDYALVAKAGLGSTIYGFNLVNLANQQISSVTVDCNSVIGFFIGFSCPLGPAPVSGI